MFELSWGEIALIGIVALIVIGPKELPGLLRGMGQALAKLRRMASDFQYQFNQALQEAEVDKVKSSINSVTDGINTSSTFNPIDYARDQIKSAVDDVKGTTAPTADPVIGPPKPDPLATAIPAPPSYSVDPESIQKAFAPTPPPSPFSATASPAEPAAAPLDLSPPAAEAPAEAEPAKPKRTRKAAAVEPESAPAPAAESAGDDDKPKRARKTKA
ncbi:MAG: twin-arginine translocase subunit TatB [Phreatobacter sp.]|uniref:Sec-independent protein translocase protein TatB n=1 Tax=Phreatobacter sp. TaxID=1966341 RepID=UPI001A481EF2|nr:Sec-independent protein translocase protein TatB [Phreatobacter sp.]MBL8569756.1 twin-arginine translocase subunit TatB [Phreatobacter sp.]